MNDVARNVCLSPPWRSPRRRGRQKNLKTSVNQAGAALEGSLDMLKMLRANNHEVHHRSARGAATGRAPEHVEVGARARVAFNARNEGRQIC